MKKLTILLESENVDKKVLLDVFRNYFEIRNFLKVKQVSKKTPILIDIENYKDYYSN